MSWPTRKREATSLLPVWIRALRWRLMSCYADSEEMANVLRGGLYDLIPASPGSSLKHDSRCRSRYFRNAGCALPHRRSTHVPATNTSPRPSVSSDAGLGEQGT